MKIERVIDADIDGGEGLLALIIYEVDDLPKGIQFFTEEYSELQAGSMSHSCGTTIAPHKHPPVKRVVRRTSEVLIVTKGFVRLDIYRSDKQHISSHSLKSGSIAVLVAGGHGLFFETDASIIEVKQGPYMGSSDKILF